MAELEAPLPIDPLDGASEVSGSEGVFPRSFVVLDPSAGQPVDLYYRVGTLPLDTEEGGRCAIIAVAVVDNKLLVAVPGQVWHKKPKQRRLRSGSLGSPSQVAIAVCGEEDREQPLPGTQVKIWFGFLARELEESISFAGEEEVMFDFGSADGPPLYPFGQNLMEVAQEHFAFVSAASGIGGVQEEVPITESRFLELEKSVQSLEQGIQRLLQANLGNGAGATAKAAPAYPPRRSALKTPSKAKAFPGIDTKVMNAAVEAGVPSEHLAEMSKILSKKPKRLEDVPRPAGRAKDVLSESEEEVEGLEMEAISPALDPDLPADGVALALQKLTQICSSLTESRSKKSELESLLDGVGSASTSETGGMPTARKNAAALRALQRSLRDNPKYLYETIESHMATDFSSLPVLPGEALSPGLTARGWLISRSRVQNFASHVRWTWAVAGIWDALMQERTSEARARCALLCAASDQASIDSGSWLLGSVSMLEPVAPFHQFAHHTVPGPTEPQHSALLDSRWMEIFLTHVREQDAYQESKRKLGKSGKQREDKGDKEDDPKPPRVRPKVKPNPKGKAAPGPSSSDAMQA